jgi:NADH-quinone oxidoreductase subunit F
MNIKIKNEECSMVKCIFCGKQLEKGNVCHNDETCKKELSNVKTYLEQDRITVGLATCGISAGADETLIALKESNLELPIDEVGCAGMCFNEPVVTVKKANNTYIYSNLTKNLVSSLVESIKKDLPLSSNLIANKLEDLDFFKNQKRIIMKRCGIITPTDLKQYIATDGFIGLVNAFKISPAEVIAEIKQAGLRGRGGAGFSTGMKWEFLSKAVSEDKYMIINADEGDPGAFMNRTLMESDPFQILEGLIIGAYATGANNGIIYTRAEYPLAIQTLEKAIEILREYNILGNNILGTDFNFDVKIMKGAGAFVCGEETSLLNSIEGRRGHPRPRPPYPAESGLYKKPTNINNVESYAHAANIMAVSAEEYKKVGSPNNPGTKCVCLTGKVKNSGVVEVPLGMKLRSLIFDIGGGIKSGKKFKAVQSGGPSGGCICEAELDTMFDYDHIPATGAIMGSGGLVVMDEDDCMVDVSKFFLTFTTEESCGKCVPCREGTKRMLELVDKISKGLASESDLNKLRNLAAVISDTALCGLGQTAPNPVLSTIDKFKEEYLLHINEKKCSAKKCLSLLSYKITKACIGCGNCERNCPTKAITGKLKEQFIIDQEKCVKCGLCVKKCAFSAIIKE